MLETIEDLLAQLKTLGFRVNGIGQRDESWSGKWWACVYRRRSSKDSSVFFLTEFGDSAAEALSAVLQRARKEPVLDTPLREDRPKPAKQPAKKAVQLDLLGDDDDEPAPKKPAKRPAAEDLLG